MQDVGGAGSVSTPARDATPGADVWRRTTAGLSRTVSIDGSWWSWGAVHTGYVGSLGLEAMGAAVGGMRPVRGLSITFVLPVGDRPLTLNTAVERIGSTSTVTSLRADQEGDLVLIGMGTFGAAGPGPRHAGLAPPAVPRPEACPLLPPGPMPFFQHLDVRSATDARCLGGGDRAELTAWVRFTDGRAISTAGVTMLLDGLGPGLYAMLKAPISMPLMQFSVEFAADLLGESLDGWVLVRTRTDHAGGSWATDDSTAWSEDGRLLAHSRHSRRLILAPS